MRNFWNIKNRGVSSIEVVIGVTIAGVVLIYSANAVSGFVNNARDVTLKTEALYLVEEGIELVKFVRDNSWITISSLPLNTTRYLVVGSSSISITTTPETVDGFLRSFTVRNVYRDATTDDIVASTTSGSVADTGSKYITMSVSWSSPKTTVSIETILADIAL